jgi:hypothetical protein
MEKKIKTVEFTKSKYYEFTESHYLNLTLENVDGIDPRSILSVIFDTDEENLKMNERVEILKITNPDGEIIEGRKNLEEINSNKNLRLFLYNELKYGDFIPSDDDDDDNDDDEDYGDGE